MQNGKFEIVVLNSNEAAAVQKNVVAKSSGAYYEGKLLAVGSEVQTKTRKVYLSITSKQLTIKEYFLRVLPIRVATFRLTPNTKVQIHTNNQNIYLYIRFKIYNLNKNKLQLQFLMTNNQHGLPTILIDDGSQPTIKVAVKDAKIIVATFTHFLLRNIGNLDWRLMYLLILCGIE